MACRNGSRWRGRCCWIPPCWWFDEATDGLDPEGARRVQDLIRGIADSGTSVVWTTQRLDEIRSFADAVTVLDRVAPRFTVPLRT